MRVAVCVAKQGMANIQFSCLFLAGKTQACIQLLLDTERFAEAAFFAKTYCPRQTSHVVGLWRASVAKRNKRVADCITDPVDYPDMHPGFDKVCVCVCVCVVTCVCRHRLTDVP